MKEFIINLKNKPGELARVCDVLGKQGVNIISLYGEGEQESGRVIVITADEKTTEKALAQNGFEFTANEIMPLRIADRPGELAKHIYKLAYHQVNINRIYLVDKKNGWAELGMIVEDPKKAEEALKG